MKKVLSHKVSDFGKYLFDRRVHLSNVQDAVDCFTDDLMSSKGEDIIFSEQRPESENEAELFMSETFGRMYEQSEKTLDNKWSVAQDLLSDMPEFKMLQNSCNGDADMAAVAASFLCKSMGEQIAEAVSVASKHEEQNQERDQLDNVMDDLKQEDQTQQDGGSSGLDSLPDDVVANLKEQFISKAEQVEKIGKDLKKAKGLISGIGNDPRNGASNNEDRAELLNGILSRPHMLNIMKMIGRLRSLMHSLPAIEQDEIEQDNVVTTGRSLYKGLLNRERQDLVDDGVQFDLFLDRYVRRTQLKWRYTGKQDKGMGPIIVCLDESGSMDGARMHMAAAFAGAVASVAKQQQREFWCIGFGRTVNYVCNISKKSKNSTWDGSKASPEGIIGKLLSRRAKGGTRFDPVIEKSIELSEKVKKADVLFLTDGQGNVSSSQIEKLKKAKEEKGLRWFTVLVGHNASIDDVQAISEGVARVKHLEDSNSLLQLAKLMKMTARR